MKEEYFLDHIVDTSQYQVFLFSSPVPLPFFFARHCWFVVNNKGTITRVEFAKFGFKNNVTKIDIFKDKNKFCYGMTIYPSYSLRHIRYNSKIHFTVEGDKNSLAYKLASFILTKSTKYPLIKEYKLLGPNSNTYPQWVLSHFPELKVKLPFLAVGKNYLKNRSK